MTPPPPPLYPRSWTLPSPVIFTASDPHAADGKAGVGTILLILNRDPNRPDWLAAGPGSTQGGGKVYQAEGNDQAEAALAQIAADRADMGSAFPPNVAVVTNGLVAPYPSRFVAAGVTSCMVECYAQAGDEPYGDLKRMTWQAHHDGWPHVIPVLGVYDNIDLAHYFTINGAGSFKGGHWHGGPLGIYLAEGMTDTGSWPTLATL